MNDDITLVLGSVDRLECPTCARLNPGDHRFCSGCGARLHQPLAIGTLLDGRYRVLEILSSSGGFATTYIIEDVQLFGRRQVLKELRPQMAEREQARELFGREARTLAGLAHPGIPRIQGFFSQSDRDYLVEDCIEGRNLGALLAERGPFSEEETLRVVMSVLATLEYLHGRTPPVVHRDIKPDNLILSDTGQVVLVDFGAVRLASRPGLLTVNEAATTIVYTRGYAPPEQILGHAVPASDLYALGATALHLLLGKNPAACFDTQTGRYEVPGGIPPRLEAVLTKLLEPRLADRYDHAGDATRDLLGAGSGIPVGPPGSLSVAAARSTPQLSLWDGGGQERGRYATSGPDPRGEVRWRGRLGSRAATSLAVWSGKLLVVGEDRSVYALDAAGGAVSWSRPLPGDPQGTVLAPEAFADRVIVQGQGALTAYDLYTGDPAWNYSTPGLVASLPLAISDDRAIAVDLLERRLVALDPEGKEAWSSSFGRKRVQADPEAILRLDGPAWATCRANTTVLAFKQTVSAFRTADGAVVWTAEQPTCHDHPAPAIRRTFGRGVVHAKRAYFYSTWDCMFCLNAADGFLHWVLHAGTMPTGPAPIPAVDAETVYVAPAGWKLFAFSLADRERKWSFSAGGRPLLGPCLMGNRLYLASDNALYALDRQTGEADWRFEAPAAFATAPLVADGVVYAGLEDGTVLALS
ncbi:MAG: PQQ-binding-like beta-propeller repeat protein [Cyanobacteria bacterium REEB65]|nr:PQQ-binding-like beta-propeller repeat protein [Cyanobacteria bacterium REEB65]